MPKAAFPKSMASLAAGRRDESVRVPSGTFGKALVLLMQQGVKCDVVTYGNAVYDFQRLGRVVARYGERTGALVIHWPEIAGLAEEPVRDTADRKTERRDDGSDRLSQDPYGPADPFRGHAARG